MRRSLAHAVRILPLCTALAACSVTVTGTGGPSPSTTQATSPTTPSQTQAPGSDWFVGNDPASGISFALPGKAKTQTRPGNDGTPEGKRAYLYAVNADLNLSVTVVDGAVAEADLDVMPDQLVEQMQAAGATDAAVSERERTTVDGHPALDFRFSFTATNGKHSFWLTREIAADRHVVLLQSIGFTVVLDKGFESFVRDHHRQLLAGLKLA